MSLIKAASINIDGCTMAGLRAEHSPVRRYHQGMCVFPPGGANIQRESTAPENSRAKHAYVFIAQATLESKNKPEISATTTTEHLMRNRNTGSDCISFS